MANNLLEINEVKEPFLQNIISQTRKEIEIYSSHLKIDAVKTYGKILAAVDAVSTMLFDFETKQTIRCPAIGKLLYVESAGPRNYDLYYHVKEGKIVVDSIRNGKYEARRDLLCASKIEISRIATSEKYILIIDTENNVEIVDKKDVFVNSVANSLKSKSFVIYRKDLFGILSRLFSGHFEAEIFANKTGIVVLVVGGSSKTVYKLEIDPKSMLVSSGPVELTTLGSSSTCDLQALFDFTQYAARKLIPISEIKILSSSHDGSKSTISTYNKHTKLYEHVILSTSADGTVEEEFKFTTESKFAVSKSIKIEYPSGTKILMLDISKSGKYAEYLLVNENGEVVNKGSTKTSRTESAILASVQNASLEDEVEEEVIEEIKAAEEEIIE